MAYPNYNWVGIKNEFILILGASEIRNKIMEYKIREYPLFSACGLNCGLCPRFYTDGDSRCPGCAGEGFSEVHPPCGVLSCCQRKNIEYCFLCDEYPCKKYDGVDLSDSFITHKNQLKDLEKAKTIGMEAYKAELDEKVVILKELLTRYNDGRKKSFYCLAVNLLDLQDIKIIMKQIAVEVALDSPIKDKAATVTALFNEMAEKRGISLKLRK
jgi:hypothetical protein